MLAVSWLAAQAGADVKAVLRRIKAFAFDALFNAKR
jgi:hypothetical protein